MCNRDLPVECVCLRTQKFGLLIFPRTLLCQLELTVLMMQEYIAANADQVPAPFIVLADQLPMALTYEAAFLDPSNASVADRLRKQAKTRAMKLLRELIYDPASKITSLILRGYEGAIRPADNLVPLIR